MQCKCVSKVNRSLKKDGGNTELATTLAINFTTGKGEVWPSIATRKRDPKNREKAKTIFPTYCPFCGKLTRSVK